MKHTLNLDTTVSPGDADHPLPPGEPLAHRQTDRRTLLGWMVGMAAGAFALSFAVPAAALRALMLEKPVIAPGDVLTYADTATGGQPGQPFKAADLAVGGSAQLFPLGKSDNQDNLLQVVRIAEGAGAAGLVAYSAICTHLGCAVFEKLNRDGLILCPCHGSIYDPANHAVVRRGPSDRALPGIAIADGPNGTVLANGPFDGPIGPQ
ncbi:MAG TPA: ubiquinol-cytochrome c reductase iron-sulfur subunit [Chloroflexota bacterium]|nr:ubiquinol-cytochrome c reductase iron-sulfur subunit [Chloroflexota bacterium]